MHIALVIVKFLNDAVRGMLSQAYESSRTDCLLCTV
jgi:hypothetical protein